MNVLRRSLTTHSGGPVPDRTQPRHSPAEDVLALIVGAFLLSWGLVLLTEVGAVSGGVAGAAVLISYVSPWSVGLIFFVINLPFYVLGVYRMGWLFTLKTLAVVTMTSLFLELHTSLTVVQIDNAFYACAFAGLVIGLGMVVLFRHHASAGGLGILVYFLQERFGWRGGYIQMAVDVAIVGTAAFVVDPIVWLASIVGVIALNLVVALNHRPGRYVAASTRGTLRQRPRHGSKAATTQHATATSADEDRAEHAAPTPGSGSASVPGTR